MTTTEQAPGAGFAEGHVEIEGFTVRYHQAGPTAATGEPADPLVVLHGAGGLHFSVALDLLARVRRVVLVEMPGFGEQVNDVHQSSDELAEAIARTVEAIGIERYHLLGHSLGGIVALHLAFAHPDRLASLVLDGPAGFREGESAPAATSPQEMVRRFRAQPERAPAFTPPDPALMARVMPLAQRLMISRPPYDQELADRLPQCAVRTLVLFGDRDGVVPPQNGRTYRRLMPNCSFQLVHRAAHSVQDDRPEAYAELVGDFLERGWMFLVPEQSTLINP